MTPERVAVLPGSFDPLTNGHVDLAVRAAAMFDRVVVGVLVNTAKTPLFDAAERVEIAREALAGHQGITVEQFQGLLVDFARRHGATVVVRGVRAAAEIEAELPMALMNRRMAPEIETVFLAPDEANAYVSSRLVREIARLGGPVGRFVPPGVARRLQERLERS